MRLRDDFWDWEDEWEKEEERTTQPEPWSRPELDFDWLRSEPLIQESPAAELPDFGREPSETWLRSEPSVQESPVTEPTRPTWELPDFSDIRITPEERSVVPPVPPAPAPAPVEPQPVAPPVPPIIDPNDPNAVPIVIDPIELIGEPIGDTLPVRPIVGPGLPLPPSPISQQPLPTDQPMADAMPVRPIVGPGLPLPPSPIPQPPFAIPQLPFAILQPRTGSSDIDELRAAPWTTAFEQAALAQADELVNQRYQALREQRAQELARRGITPDSGLWQREMGQIDRDAAREAAAFRRRLQLEAIDRRQRNLAAARAIEAMMENMERQRLFDLLAMLSGNPSYAAAAGQAAGALAPLLGQQAAMFGQAAGSAFGNLGDLFAMLLGMNQRPPQAEI